MGIGTLAKIVECAKYAFGQRGAATYRNTGFAQRISQAQDTRRKGIVRGHLGNRLLYQ
jgi:hypothetical protein